GFGTRFGLGVGLAFEPHDPEPALPLGAGIVDVHDPTARSATAPDPAAVLDVPGGAKGDPGRANGQGVLAAAQEAVPGGPSGGAGLGDRIAAVCHRHATARKSDNAVHAG